VSSADVDDYLAQVDPPAKDTLDALRRSILQVVPEAEEGLSYGAPSFAVGGKVVAGFAAYRHHLSYLPHSGTLLAGVGEAVAGFRTSKGALQFPLDQPLPDALVRTLVEARMRELGLE
jgi:uncharacterized protein YdhG (YjbR/CyaY superfamily)